MAKVVWIEGEQFGGEFPTFVPTSEVGNDASASSVGSTAEAPSAETGLRIEYGPPEDRRAIVCPTARHAIDWHDEIVAASQPFVRILNAQGDVLGAEYLREQIAG